MGRRCRNGKAAIWLFVGLVGGLLAAFACPHTPLHAVATDKYDTFAIATGFADEQCEAVYFLDFLTGNLNAIVIGRMASGGFGVTGHYAANVVTDLQVDAGKSPKFLMVTGMADLARGGRGGTVQPSKSVLYVAEVTTGRAVAYAIPWNPTAHARGTPVQQQLVKVLAFPFRAAPGGAVKTGETQ